MTVLAIDSLTIRAGGRELVANVGFSVNAGERVGIIGESGSGKSLTALAAMGLLPDGLDASGTISLAGIDPLRLPERELARVRGERIAMVFQEPMTALNPLMRAGDQIAETLRLHKKGTLDVSGRVLELLRGVRLPDPAAAAKAYPHELSGGQRQRVMIAIALANSPSVLICDEPTTALDVTVQAQILDLIRDRVTDNDTALLFITHDLAVVSQVCERVIVLYRGEIVEAGPLHEVFGNPQHEYTRDLLAASVLAPGDPRPGARPEAAIECRDLVRTYRRARTSLRHAGREVSALRGVSLTVSPGQRFGIVGESGSGKSTLVRLIAGLDRATSGKLRFEGRDLVGRSDRQLGFLRSALQVVFQDPMGSLDPRMRVSEIIAEPILAQGGERAAAAARVAELLDAVRLPADAAIRYPHQFSGGERQRISIARALSVRPRVLIADEPVSALDVSVRAQVLDLLTDLVERYSLTLVFVSHDLAVIRHVCDMVAVMRSGEIVEIGPTERVYNEPQHEYTRALIAATPKLVL